MELKREIIALENKLSVEKAATDAERRKNHAMSEQQNIEDNERLSPTPSTEQDSVNTEIDSIWTVMRVHIYIVIIASLFSFLPELELKNFIFIFQLCNPITENKSESYTVAFDTIRAGSSSTSIFENLQAQLKQKDGTSLDVYQ